MRKDFRYISLFSGIEAATVAWESCGWKPEVFAEFDEFPSAVLAHHYPDIPNLGDVTEVDWNDYRGTVDLVVGGSPCQSFSVAGQRLGLADPRGNLALHFLRVVEAVQPRWFVFENVAGLLSSDGGRDFATFLGEVAQLGYGFAFRILDAKHFGVAQRRRRVFVVGHIGGDWRRAASVLFERESLCGNPTPRKAEREGSTPNAGSGSGEEGEAPTRTGVSWDGKDHISTITAKAHDQRMPDKAHFLGVIEPESTLGFDHTFGQNYGIYKDESPTLKVNGAVPTSPAVAFDWKNITQTNPSEESTDPLTREGSLAIGFTQNQREEVRDLEDTAATLKPPGTHESTMVAQPEVVAIRTGGDFADPTITIDDKAFLAANPMSDRQMAVFDARGNGEGDVSNTLVGDHQGRVTDYTAVAIQDTSSRDKAQNGKGWKDDETSYTLDTKGLQGANVGMSVRRLTPVECERLQGFPDDYTRIAWKKKEAENCPDGHRFKALGNSMAVPVMRWLGQRIALVDAIPIEGEAHNTGADWL